MNLMIAPKFSNQQMPLMIIDAGYQQVKEKDQYTWPFHQIVCCYKGEGTVIIDQKEYKLSPGSIFYMEPHVKHEYQYHHAPYYLSWVSFEGYLMNTLPSDYGLISDKNHAVIHDQFHPEIHLQIMSILEQVGISFLMDRASVILFGILVEFFLQYKYKQSKKPDKHNNMINQAIEWMKEHIHSPRDISLLADELHISRQHLSRLFRQRYSTTTKDFFLKLKILQAQKNLVEFPETSVKEIAHEMGFVNASHFTKVFNKIVGVSPTEYRLTNKRRLISDLDRENIEVTFTT
jgi:AraC family transcriptional regulator of arabinose operon